MLTETENGRRVSDGCDGAYCRPARQRQDIVHSPNSVSPCPPPPGWLRGVYLAAGLAFVGLGLIGAFLPVLPTTPFLIVAVACFARSSKPFESWFLEHRRFGPILQEWRRRGAIPRRAKFAALAGMVIGYGVFWTGSNPGPALAASVAALMLTV